MLILLKLLNGEEIEQSVDSDVCVIGRSSKCNIVVPHEGMSRMHCQIEFLNGDYFVTDLGSTNGVLIDGQKIEPNKKVPYQTYLNLSFGAVQSLQIKEDSTLAAIIRAPSTPVPEEAKEKVSSITRIKTVKETTKPTLKHETPKIKNTSEEKLRTWAVIILILLMIGGAIYMYLPKDSSERELTPEEIYN